MKNYRNLGLELADRGTRPEDSATRIETWTPWFSVNAEAVPMEKSS